MQRIYAALLLLALLITAPLAYAAEGQSRTLTSGGVDRTYLVYRPATLARTTEVPLVIMMHGGFGNGAQAERSYNWDEKADQEGFVVAYPDGIGRSWNAGSTCCGHAARDKVDDVAFITDLIKTISHDENINPKRVYLTGMSNGAAMSYRYACEGTYPIAAIGPISGSFSYTCAKPHPVSVMEIHGADDKNIPLAGGQGSKGVSKVEWLPVKQSIDWFRTANNCQPPESQQNGGVQVSTSSCAEGHQVILITIEGAGHQWPGAKAKNFVQRLMGSDAPSEALDATSSLWVFFQSQAAK